MCLSLVHATLAFSTLALICPKFPSFFCTIHAMSSYEQQGLCSSFAKGKKNAILLFFQTSSLTSEPPSETALPHVFLLPPLF